MAFKDLADFGQFASMKDNEDVMVRMVEQISDRNGQPTTDPYIDLRPFFGGRDGNLYPTTKGFGMSDPDEIEQLAQALLTAAQTLRAELGGSQTPVVQSSNIKPRKQSAAAAALAKAPASTKKAAAPVAKRGPGRPRKTA